MVPAVPEPGRRWGSYRTEDAEESWKDDFHRKNSWSYFLGERYGRARLDFDGERDKDKKELPSSWGNFKDRNISRKFLLNFAIYVRQISHFVASYGEFRI